MLHENIGDYKRNSPMPLLKFVHKIDCYSRSKIFKQCSISGMRSEETSCEPLLCLIFFIGTCVKRDTTSKLRSRSMGRSRIFCIFCMKSVELVSCDSDFPGRSCSVCTRKRGKLYVGDKLYGADNPSEGDVWFVYFWSV